LPRRAGSASPAAEEDEEIFDRSATFPRTRPSAFCLRTPRRDEEGHELAAVGESSGRRPLLSARLPGDAAGSSAQYVATLKMRNAALTDQIRRLREGHVRTMVQMKNELVLHKLDPTHKVQLVDFFSDPDGDTIPMQNELHELRIGLTETAHELQALKGERGAAIRQVQQRYEKEVALLKVEVERLREESSRQQATSVEEALRSKEARAELQELKETSAEKSATFEEELSALKEELRQSRSRVESAEAELRFFKETAVERTLLLEKTLRLLKVGARELGFDDMTSFEIWAAHAPEEESGPTRANWTESEAARRKAEGQLEAERLEVRGAQAPQQADPTTPLGGRVPRRLLPRRPSEAAAELQDGGGGGPPGGGLAGGGEERPPVPAALCADAVRETRLRGDVSQVNLDRLIEALVDGATLSKRAIWLDAAEEKASEPRGAPGVPPALAPRRRSRQLGQEDGCPRCRQSRRHRRSSVVVSPGRGSVVSLSRACEGAYLGAKEPRHGSARSLLAFLKDSPASAQEDEALAQGTRRLQGVTIVRREVLPPLLPFTEGFLPVARPKRRGNYTAR